MGFSRKMVKNLLIYEEIEDTNSAVEMLLKGNSGWTHKFRKGRGK